MFCRRCNSNAKKDSRFCEICGYKIESRLLISDGGRGHKEIKRLWIVWVMNLGIMVALVLVMFYIAGTMDGQGFGFGNLFRPVNTSKISNLIRVITTVVAVTIPSFVLVIVIISHRSIVKTAIWVYDNGVKGVGVENPEDGPIDFWINVDQIISADVMDKGSLISINTPSRQYKIHANNAPAVARVVNSML